MPVLTVSRSQTVCPQHKRKRLTLTTNGALTPFTRQALCLPVEPCSSPAQWRVAECSPGQRPSHLPSPGHRPGYRSTQTHERANGPAVCAGSSIPNVSFVNLDAVLFAEPPVFVLERTRREMIPFGETLVVFSSRRRCATRLVRAIVAWCDYPLLVPNGRAVGPL